MLKIIELYNNTALIYTEKRDKNRSIGDDVFNQFMHVFNDELMVDFL